MIIYNDNDNSNNSNNNDIYCLCSTSKRKGKTFYGSNNKNSKKLWKILRLKFKKCLTIYKHAFS